MTQMTATLPWPPSTNRYWRNNRGRTHISNKGRQYRKDAEAALLAQFGQVVELRGSLAVSILAVMPDRRKRDLDNLLKATLDAITHSGFWQDDSQVDELTIVRGPVVRGGSLRVTIKELRK